MYLTIYVKQVNRYYIFLLTAYICAYAYMNDKLTLRDFKFMYLNSLDTLGRYLLILKALRT